MNDHPGSIARRTPHKPAVLMATGEQLTYRQLDDASNRLAHALRAAGLGIGDHIAFVLENRLELFVVAWAAQRAGLYYTACSTRLTSGELEHIVDDCGARVLFASPETVDVAALVFAGAVERRVLVDGSASGWERLDDLVAGHPVTPIPDEAEGAYMLYSSGTTGRPKGVRMPLPDGPFPQPNATAALHPLFGIDADTVYLSPAPLYHTAPLRFSLSIHRVGGTVVVQRRFDAVELLDVVERYAVSVVQLVPTMFVRLLKLDDAVRSSHELGSLRAVIHAAAPCPPEVKQRMIEWWGPIVHEYYSGTEGICFVHCTSHEWLSHRGTVGRSLLGPAHILDDHGEEVPTGGHGLIYFERSGFEYHNDLEATAASRDPKGRGWSTLGDIGYVDDDGFVYLTDRRAHMIISGGVNIYPREAEDALALHPKVADVAVFGIPDDDMGERVHAVVQPADGVIGTDELAAELIAFCRHRLAHYKCPRSVTFRPELPRHPTGKLHKRILRDEHWTVEGLRCSSSH